MSTRPLFGLAKGAGHDGAPVTGVNVSPEVVNTAKNMTGFSQISWINVQIVSSKGQPKPQIVIGGYPIYEKLTDRDFQLHEKIFHAEMTVEEFIELFSKYSVLTGSFHLQLGAGSIATATIRMELTSSDFYMELFSKAVETPFKTEAPA